LKHLVPIVFIAATAVGIAFPELAALRPVVPVLIAVILYANFVDIRLQANRLLRRELLVTLPIAALVVPGLIYLLLSRGLPEDFRLGLLLTALTPAGIMPLVIAPYLVRIDHELLLSNFMATTFGAVLYLPLMVKILAGRSVAMPISQLIVQAAAMIVLPCIAARATQHLLAKEATARFKQVLRPVVALLLFAVVAVVMAGARGRLTWSLDLVHLVALVCAVYAIQGTLAWSGGFLFADPRIRNTLALAASSRNNQISLGIATIHFSPAVALPCVIGFLVHHGLSIGWLWIFKK
jgi:BASS family bile acid:Na+ symporter